MSDQSSPTRMYGGSSPREGVGEQSGEAIRGPHGTRDVGGGTHYGIRFCEHDPALLLVPANLDDVPSVNL